MDRSALEKAGRAILCFEGGQGMALIGRRN